MSRPTFNVSDRQSIRGVAPPADAHFHGFVIPRPSQLAEARARRPETIEHGPVPDPQLPSRQMRGVRMMAQAVLGRLPWTPPLLPWRNLTHAAAIAAVIGVVALVPLPTAASGSPLSLAGMLIEAVSAPAGEGQKVAIIVGPVGDELTPIYIDIAEAAAIRATELGATVARAYSPTATPDNVIAAVQDANIVVYLGHGVGFPNPYSDVLDPESVNGFGLQGPNARGDHADSWQDGTLKYYGEAWLAANAAPAPGWVMIHSNVCYAPGAGEGFDVAATPEVAATRVSNYSRAPLLEMGAGAYFATDFYKSAAELVGSILSRPDATFGEIYASETRYQEDAVSRVAHALEPGSEVWLQHSPYFEAKTDYWYAFAGDPNATPASVRGIAADALALAGPPAPTDVVTGIASYYVEAPGWDQPTVQLPATLGGGPPTADSPKQVVVCGDRCMTVVVADDCDCLSGTANERVINLSEHTWQMVTDQPLDVGLVEVTVHLGQWAPSASPAVQP